MRNPVRSVRRRLRRWLGRQLRLRGSPYSFHDLESVDKRHREMWEPHAALHDGAIGELAGRGFRTMLEVACGTAWNVPAARRAGLAYTGLDVSETAIAAAALKHPDERFLNLGIDDASVLADGSFDVVYSSAMLEHVGYHGRAIAQMLRLARRELRIVFFEGLSDAEADVVEFHPVTPEQVEADEWCASRTDPSRVERNPFGRKLVTQASDGAPGWYWNRYARRPMLALFEGLPHAVRCLDRGDRPWIGEETLLVVEKAPI